MLIAWSVRSIHVTGRKSIEIHLNYKPFKAIWCGTRKICTHKILIPQVLRVFFYSRSHHALATLKIAHNYSGCTF
jgi:hypothetical protein